MDEFFLSPDAKFWVFSEVEFVKWQQADTTTVYVTHDFRADSVKIVVMKLQIQQVAPRIYDNPVTVVAGCPRKQSRRIRSFEMPNCEKYLTEPEETDIARAMQIVRRSPRKA